MRHTVPHALQPQGKLQLQLEGILFVLVLGVGVGVIGVGCDRRVNYEQWDIRFLALLNQKVNFNLM